MTAPRGVLYGLKPESHNGYCNYMPGPDAPACLAEAVWHGIILTEDRTALAHVTGCCDRHRGDMARSTDFIHPHGTACIPAANVWWDGELDPSSGCEIDWDTTALSVAESAPVTA